MFTGSTKNPPPKSPQPERLDEVYAALRRGLQSYLQVHQLELDSLGQQIIESKRNGRLGYLYELDKQVKAIERFMRRLEFHLSKVEELYDAYCMQRRLRDGAGKMVAAFNSTTGSKEARESLSEANRGYREYTEHMCSLESELESQMGEFHIKMKGLAGFARLCAGDQYEVLMRYGRQRWRLRGRVEVSCKQVWDSEDNIFMPLVTELLSIKVTELKSLANHVVVGSVSCETLDLFCPLPQTVAVDINDLGTVKLNLEVTWSPFDKDDQASSASTVSKRFLSNQSPPDTPSMREQVFYSLLRRQGELENGTVWSNSSESSDDSSSPAMGHGHRTMASHTLQTTPTIQISFTPRQSSVSTPSLSSNQEEDEPDAGETDSVKWAVPNGHLQGSRSLSHISEGSIDCALTDRLPGQSVQSPETPEPQPHLDPTLSCLASHCSEQERRPEALGLPECRSPVSCSSAPEGQDGTPQASALQAEKPEVGVEAGVIKRALGEGLRMEHSQRDQTSQGQELGQKQLRLPGEKLTGRTHSRSSSFSQAVETALESFDFLNCSDLDDEDEEEEKEPKEEEEEDKKEEDEKEKEEDKKEEDEKEKEQEEEEDKKEEKEKEQQEREDEEKKDNDQIDTAESSDESDGEGTECFVEAPEGFRNSDCPPLDDDCSSQLQVESTEQLQASSQMIEELEEDREKEKEEEEQVTETNSHAKQEHGEETSKDEEPCPSNPCSMATTVL